MNIITYFKLPIMSFLVAFCLLFMQLMVKIAEVSTENFNYHYSPGFMRILGVSLFISVCMAICLHNIKRYLFNRRNVIFVIITVSLTLILSTLSEIHINLFFWSVFGIETSEHYQFYLFWYPVVSRLATMIIIFCTIKLIAYFVKHHLNWLDEDLCTLSKHNEVSKYVQNIYFMMTYLAVNFILQRYLYVAVYIFRWSGSLPEFQNISFYVSAIITASLLFIYFKQHDKISICFNGQKAFNMAAGVLLVQLIVSIVISFLVIYSIKFDIIEHQQAEYLRKYYLVFTHISLKSMYVVSILTCLGTYFISRCWFEKAFSTKTNMDNLIR